MAVLWDAMGRINDNFSNMPLLGTCSFFFFSLVDVLNSIVPLCTSMSTKGLNPTVSAAQEGTVEVAIKMHREVSERHDFQ